MAVEAVDLEDWNQQDRWWASHSLREIPIEHLLPHAERIERLAEDEDQRVRVLVEPVIRRLQRARR